MTTSFSNRCLNKMDARVLFLCLALFAEVQLEYVNKKFCRNVNQSKCSIHSVKIDPCPDGPGFCLLRRGKPYTLSFDFTPHFDANKLKMSIYSDNDNSGTFNTAVTPPLNACQRHACPLEEDVRTVFDTDFVFDTKAHGKFPLEFKLWNEDDESQACCFSFKVNMLK
ncbi:unnamed protein product, partial [Brenthis ino]